MKQLILSGGLLESRLYPTSDDALSGIRSGGQNGPQQVQLFGESLIAFWRMRRAQSGVRTIRRYV
ncbi:hypothetical protein [Bradyrhizobium murdochi]|uniref:hypothetical protein n=1 Tax=Bradyrhizobium murdochi TaxID=1038859 RepID=UPI0012EC2A90|nr:hypothetical protein [Bradyrhizobium murdochi]